MNYHNKMADAPLAQVSVNPVVLDSIHEGMRLSEDLMFVADQVGPAFAAEREAYRQLTEARQSLEDALNTALEATAAEARLLKSGPLNGIAVSSDAYKLAVRKLTTDLLDGDLRDYQTSVRRAESMHLAAEVEYKSVTTRYQALKSLVELRASMLRALAA